MQYVEIKDGVIVAHYCAKTVPNGNKYRKVTNFTATVGAPVDQIDNDGRLFTKEEIVSKGILSVGDNESVCYNGTKYFVQPDYREKNYWYKETGRKVSFKIGQKPDDTMTDVTRDDPESEWNGDGWEVPTEILKARVRYKRDSLLLQTDYVLMPDYPCSNKGDFMAYRQELRDITKQEGFPKIVQWPTKPSVVDGEL